IVHNVMTKMGGVAKVVQVGVRDIGAGEMRMIDDSNGRIVTFFDDVLAQRKERGSPFAELADEIVAQLPDDVYLSWNEAIGLLRAVRRAKKRIVGFDLCEVAPGSTEWDANVAARLLYKMIGF